MSMPTPSKDPWQKDTEIPFFNDPKYRVPPPTKYTWKERVFMTMPGLASVYAVNLFVVGALPNLFAFLAGCWCGKKILLQLKTRVQDPKEFRNAALSVAVVFFFIALFFNVLGQQLRRDAEKSHRLTTGTAPISGVAGQKGGF